MFSKTCPFYNPSANIPACQENGCIYIPHRIADMQLEEMRQELVAKYTQQEKDER